MHRWVFPRPTPPKKNGIGLLLDEVQTEEVLDLRPVDFLGPVPLELIESFGQREARAADMVREALVFAPGDLGLDQALQVLKMSPLLFGGRLRQFMVIGADIGQLQSQQ